MRSSQPPADIATASDASDDGHVAIPRHRLAADWATARDRARGYTQTLGIAPEEGDALAARAVEIAATRSDWHDHDATAETIRALQELLTEAGDEARNRGTVRSAVTGAAGSADRADHAGGSPDERSSYLRWRLKRFFPSLATAASRSQTAVLRPLLRGGALPAIDRRGMLPAPIGRFFRRVRRQRFDRPSAEMQRGAAAVSTARAARKRRRGLRWRRVSLRRRLLLGALILVPTFIASDFMVQVMPHHGGTPLERVIAVLFGALFGWISVGFWTALIGFFVLLTRRDRFAVTADARDEASPIDPAARTALIMPICEEPVARVFAGLYATYRSLERTGHLDRFDLFILSDTADPAAWIAEEEAWARLCRRVGGHGRIFYRRRRVRIKRKSGNVAEFCRAWGKRYRYMVCLDADSVMSGATIVAMVKAMENHPDAGMVQTSPMAFGRRSLFARAQQFAMRVYGPLFSTGLHFWQLGDGQYWGHNAIIRIAPFMDHCGLGRLPGKPPLGGEILSHDFVEAALMGRAGWTLWLAYDLNGSWEQIPSSLLEEMKRDRRWCQGNLQHLRLLPTKGLFGAHRALFVNGALSYVSALLWFTFLVVSTTEAVLDVFRPTDYFPQGRSLFPEWPVWRPEWAVALLAVTAMLLFLPKLLAAVLVIWRRQSRAYAGVPRMLASVVVEITLSSLFAPIRMVFHTRFVVTNLLGRTVSWHSSKREDAETSWGEALRLHGLDTLIATAWGGALLWLKPHYFIWIAPVLGALFLSIPISVVVSHTRVGDWARRIGLFVTPEESDPAPELRDVEADAAAAEQDSRGADHFIRAATEPSVNALHRALLGSRRKVRSDIAASRREILERVVHAGPDAAETFDRRVLLSDPDLVDELHRRVWALPPAAASRWRLPEVS